MHEAGKSDAYIKLRIRWPSDCFKVYLCNTKTICEQHHAAQMTNDVILLNTITMDVDAEIPLGDLMSSAIPDEPMNLILIATTQIMRKKYYHPNNM